MDISLARTKRLKTKVKKHTLTNRIINQNMFFFCFFKTLQNNINFEGKQIIFSIKIYQSFRLETLLFFHKFTINGDFLPFYFTNNMRIA